jgi:hypothetical protein
MTRNAEHAIATWQQARRRRTAGSAIERVADGLTASGGIVLANAALSLGLGLPAGRLGAALGGSLLAGGLTWIMRARRSMKPAPRPAWATVQTAPVYGIVRVDATHAA